jgi:hypothetical protein
VSTLEEIKAATAALSPEEQMELFRWWTQSETFQAQQLATLKQDLAIGIGQLEQGQYRLFDDANVMELAEEVSRFGRQQLKGRRD